MGNNCLLYVVVLATSGYRVLTVHTNGNFIVLPYGETRPLAPWPDIQPNHIILVLFWSLEFIFLQHLKALIYDNVYLWWLYSAVSLGNLATGTIIQYPTQSHRPDIELTNVFSILLMMSTKLGSDKCQFYMSLVWLDRPKLNLIRWFVSVMGWFVVGGWLVMMVC